MTKKNSTKRALVTSVLAIVLCLTMLIGTTFAWFTDTATTGVNKITSGNLHVAIQGEDNQSIETLNWVAKDGRAQTEILWEPGATYTLTPFKIVNTGNLALKYKLVVTGLDGDSELLDVIHFTYKLGDQELELSKEGNLAANGGATGMITVSAHMDEAAGNEYQDKTLEGVQITVYATQDTVEYDSNGNTYDANATYDESAGTTIQVNTENIQDYLDGKYGSINGATLVLAAGNYDALTIGGVTADTKGDIVLTCNHTNGESYSFTTAEEYKEHVAENVFHYTSTYTRTMSNVTFVANGDVTVEGVLIESGHLYQNANPFREGYTGYYMNHSLTNFTFSGIKFSGNVNINTSSADTVIDGFTFDNCTFTTSGISSDKGQAIRYYNENNNEQVKNLVVKNCTFNNCYQGVYTRNVRNVSVTSSSFDTTGHNAIAIQDSDSFNHGAVVITNNTFTNINDRIIRFNNVGANTQITIKNNTATNSGDTNNEVIKATTLATGITYDISGNNWGDNRIVCNDELKNK